MVKSTSADRIFLALERKQPDRIPHFENGIDPKVMNSILPGATYEQFIERFDWDALVHGDQCREDILSENPKVVRDEWGTIKRYSTEIAAMPIETPIKSERDLEKYKTPDPDVDWRFEQLQRWSRRYKGDRAIVADIHDPFPVACSLFGFSEQLIAFYTNPELVLNLHHIVLDYYLRYMNNAIEAGADIVFIGGDWAYKNGPMFSQEHLKKFVLPPFKTMVQEAKKRGIYVIKHTDGNCWSILDNLINTGIDAFHPVDPMADMNIGEVKQKYGDKISLMGNVNCATTLSFATVDEVQQETKDVIRKAGPGGGLIISSSNTIHSAVKPENYVEMVRVIRQYGKYPLNFEKLN